MTPGLAKIPQLDSTVCRISQKSAIAHAYITPNKGPGVENIRTDRQIDRKIDI